MKSFLRFFKEITNKSMSPAIEKTDQVAEAAYLQDFLNESKTMPNELTIKIVDHMKLLRKQVTFSPNASCPTNVIPNDKDIRGKVDRYDTMLLLWAARPAKRSTSLFYAGMGNCLDNALFLLLILLSDKTLPDNFKNKLELCAFTAPSDHAFLRYENIILDPWYGLVDIKKPEGTIKRTRGYIGTEENYIETIKKIGCDLYISQTLKLDMVSLALTRDSFEGALKKGEFSDFLEKISLVNSQLSRIEEKPTDKSVAPESNAAASPTCAPSKK